MQEELKAVSNDIERLADGDDDILTIMEKLNEVIDKVNSLKVRDRGPSSTQSMNEELAHKVLMEEPYCNMSHKKAAQELGLSYGQVSSVRGGYTFKNQYKIWREAGSKETWSRDYQA